MAGDQQFCLRWNNHQSTLVSVFDALLENSVLVDCTLAADGQQLKAHKVVLSACSPYLETLLSQHYDKHPIIILKDVKFPELKAMLDYMYRGEVNISQDLLGSFLKAAESLQIKGLTDSGGGGVASGEPPSNKESANRKQSSVSQPTTVTPIINNHNRSVNPTVPIPEERKPQNLGVIPTHVLDNRSQSPLMLREGSVSPTIRKRKKLNQLSKTENSKLVKTYNNDTTGNANVNSPNETTTTSQIIPTNLSATNSPASNITTVIKSEPDTLPLSNKTEFKQNIDDNGLEDNELINDENNENVFEDDTTNTTTSPGPSHHFISQGFSEKTALGDSSSELVLQASDDLQSSNQEPRKLIRRFSMVSHLKKEMNSFRNSNPLHLYNSDSVHDGNMNFNCPNCQKMYKSKSSLSLHMRLECGKEPKFLCPFCMKRCFQKGNLKVHILTKHKDKVAQNLQSEISQLFAK